MKRSKKRRRAACDMCGSRKHSSRTHKKHAAQGRLRSKKWVASMHGESKSLKMRKFWEDNYEEMCQKRREQVTPKVLAANSKRLKKQWSDPEWYAKMCKVRKTQSKGNQSRSPRGSWYRCKYKGINGKFWMRSSWEVALALWMDHYGIEWEYETHRFWLRRGKYYRPDFWLPNQKDCIEIKGWVSTKDEYKMKRFCKVYPEIELFVFEGKNLKNVLTRFQPKITTNELKERRLNRVQ